jgi:hypothetical protein
VSVSLVVPTAGVSDQLHRSVVNMIESAARTGPDAEVLVVVNGRSSVPALQTLRSPSLRVLHLDRRNQSRARNLGIEQARHDTVIFGDDGAEMPATWCADLADALRDERYPVVTAPVRVPVTGPITAYLNYQRIFDAPPINEIEALTVTGALGIRRDRLPATARYDESNLPEVGEDAALGLALRQAGIPIRWLADVTPARHLLPERIEEITERAYRYGGAAARVACRNLGPVPEVHDVLSVYRALVLLDYRGYRRFSEVATTGLRSAFTVYDYLFTVSWLVGYLDGAGRELGTTIVDVGRDALRTAVRELAAAAATAVEAGAWDLPTVDFRRLGTAASGHDVLVGRAREALMRHVTLCPPRSTRGDDAPRPVRAGGPRRRADDRVPHLLAAWHALRDGAGALDADALDRVGRTFGFGFRQACETIERCETVG